MEYKTPIAHLNLILGGSGIQIPSIIEFFGSENSAKSTLAQFLAIHFLKSFSQSKLFYINSEFKLDEKRFDYIMFNNGIDKKQYEIWPNNILEDIGQELEKRLKEAELDEVPLLITWDSVANVKSKDSSGAGYSGAKDAAMISSMLSNISELLYKTNSHLLVINQVRDNLGGKGFRTPKGRALKHLAVIRCKLQCEKKVMKKVDGVEIEDGIVVNVKTEKNQLFIPRLNTKLYIQNETGVNVSASIHEVCKAFNIFSSAGAWTSFKYGDYNFKWRGITEFADLLAANEELLELLSYLLIKKYSGISHLVKIKLIDDLWRLEDKFGFEKTELTDKEKEMLEHSKGM